MRKGETAIQFPKTFRAYYIYEFKCITCALSALSHLNQFQAKMHQRAFPKHKIILTFGEIKEVV